MHRRIARENSFLLIFETLFNEEISAEEIFENATTVRGLEYDDYVKNVFFGCVENAVVISDTVEKCLVGWSKNRVSHVSSAVIELATYELMFLDDVPVKVAINEAIELSKKYDEDKAYVFVNGVLNKVAEVLGKK